jgi:hypothetical protein
MANFGLNAAPQAYLQGFDVHSDVKGKGKFKETDFDAAFAQAASSISTTSAKIETQSSGDAVDELEKDLNNARLDDATAATPEGLLGNVEFKRSVRTSALVSVVKLTVANLASVASGSRCRILICLLNRKKWPSGKQNSINS